MTRWWRVANGNRFATQCQRRLDASPVAVMQFQQRLSGGDLFARFDAGDETDAEVNGLADLAAARAEHVAGSADGCGL
jgi:hypothetical protein